jgi:hypothetical protein
VESKGVIGVGPLVFDLGNGWEVIGHFVGW